MPTTNDLINASYQVTWDNQQAAEEYDQWLEAEDRRRKELAEARRIFHLHCRTQEEIEEDPDYEEDF